jgi:two-component system, NtrC family, response regulator AtoC
MSRPGDSDPVVSEIDDAQTRSLFQRATAGGNLLLIQDGASTIHPLPSDGTLLIGRGPDADLKLSDSACSRRHAELVVESDQVVVRDLGSHNGTLVNGARVNGTRRVAAGDVVLIGDAIIVVHTKPVSSHKRFVDASTLRQRLDDELERAIRFERPLVVIAIDPETVGASLEAVLQPELGRLEVATAGAEGVTIMIAEADSDLGIERARELLARCRAAGVGVRVGVAACPDDGCRADTLIAGARAAAESAGVGAVGDASAAVLHLDVGGRRTLVADPETARVFQLLKKLATSELPVLIVGETGVGKESAAHALHAWSARAERRFVAFNAAALQETLAESELFGHERGAFTGATSTKVGLLEAASGGTVFLDEVGDLPAAIQAKLLRALEAKRVMRVGSTSEIAIDVRVVAATHKDLDVEVRAGRFRQDLFYRLGGAKVMLPALRERPRELVLLARELLDDARRAAGAEPVAFSVAAMDVLVRHPWPGNVRELKNEMAYVAATIEGNVVEPWHLAERITGTSVGAKPPAGVRRVADELRELERRRMAEALDASAGVQKRAAERIGMPLRTFRMKFKQYGLDRR